MELERLRPSLDRSQLHIRLTSSDRFSVSRQIVPEMIAGKYPPRIFYTDYAFHSQGGGAR